jgi:hypothetical protein
VRAVDTTYSATYVFEPDTTAPTISSAVAGASTLVVSFDGPLDMISAETIGNYVLDGGLSVSAAVLEADGQTVTLTVTPEHVNGTSYMLMVTGVEDLLDNAMSATPATYTLDEFRLWSRVLSASEVLSLYESGF